jgi:hypothetical protein
MDNGLGTCVFCRPNLDGSGVAGGKCVKEENADGKEASEGEVTKVDEKKASFTFDTILQGVTGGYSVLHEAPKSRFLNFSISCTLFGSQV